MQSQKDMIPVVDANLETNIPGLYLAGSIIEAECIRVAANQGYRIAKRVAGLVKSLGKAPPGVKDLIIVGAGPAGINASLTARDIGLDIIVLDQYFLGATILGMPSGKTFEVNYKGNNDPAEGPLWFEDSPAPMLHSRWMDQVKASGLTINENEPVTNIVHDKDRGLFRVRSVCGTYPARFVLLCIGKAGQPRQLNVVGELELAEKKRLHYRFRGPGTVKGKDILVVGGGNTAAEAVVGLARDNHVTLSYRRAEFERLTSKNKDALDALSNKGSIHIMLNSVVVKLDGDKARIQVNDETIERRFDEFFIMIGFELPLEFLRKIGVKMN